jgi:magnesium transporter
MIHVIDLGTNKEEQIDSKSLQELDLHNIWLEITDPIDEELQSIANKIGVSKHFLDMPKKGELISLRLESDFGIINFAAVKDVVSAEKFQPIVIVFSKTFLVTVSRNIDQSIFKTTKDRMSKIKIDPPAQVLYFIIDEIVSSHFAQLEKLEDFSSRIEEEVVEKTTPDTLRKIFNLKTKLINFNKTLWYERGLIFNLKTCDSCIPPNTRNLFNTTHEDLTRQIDIVETYREIMSDAINVHLSAVSNKINLSIQSLTVVIFYLTIITTITVFPNTVATFFGISRFGNSNIWIIVSAIIISTILPLIWLWRKNWLKYKGNF